MKFNRTDGASPLITVKIEPRSGEDWPVFAAMITALTRSDPKIFCDVNIDYREAFIGGSNEGEIEKTVTELARQGIVFEIGAPQVAYRESITHKVTEDYTHKRHTGGAGEFARVVLEVKPNGVGAGNIFESKIVEGAFPKKYVAGIEKGLNSVLSNGPIQGFPVVDVKVTLADCAYHDVDSSSSAFEIATRAAMRDAIMRAGAVVLEPVMKVEVTSREEYLGSLVGDLHLRRGQIVETTNFDSACVITAFVPLAKMFGYEHKLIMLSKGSASFKMELDRYRAMPPSFDPDNFPPAVAMRI